MWRYPQQEDGTQDDIDLWAEPRNSGNLTQDDIDLWAEPRNSGNLPVASPQATLPNIAALNLDASSTGPPAALSNADSIENDADGYKEHFCSGQDKGATAQDVDYSSQETRLLSYSCDENTEFTDPSSQERLSSAGLYFDREGQCNRCFSCGINLRDMHPYHDPVVHHADYSPRCEYLTLHHGQRFVDAVAAISRIQHIERVTISDVLKYMQDNGIQADRRNQDVMEIHLVTDFLRFGFPLVDIYRAIAALLQQSNVSCPCLLVCLSTSLSSSLSRILLVCLLGLSESFKIETGVKQGCILYPLLFGIAIDFIMKKCCKGNTGIEWVQGTQLESLDFADDITLISDCDQNARKNRRTIINSNQNRVGDQSRKEWKTSRRGRSICILGKLHRPRRRHK